jgi:hypothetical protein
MENCYIISSEIRKVSGNRKRRWIIRREGSLGDGFRMSMLKY